MLQWMGGSRRKVTTSRKSTQKRQKQYFEQRKRQQQQHNSNGLESYSDKKVRCTPCPENNRSLDILNLLNLSNNGQDFTSRFPEGRGSSNGQQTTPNSQTAHCPTTIQMEHENLCPSEDVEIRETRIASNNMEETVCPQEFSFDFTSSSHLDASKGNKEKDPMKMTTDHKLSFVDILGDDGQINSSRGNLVHENHVAFSVEGLGKVEMETPVHSPQHSTRNFSYKYPAPFKTFKGSHSSKNLNRSLEDQFPELDDLAVDVEIPIADACSLEFSPNFGELCYNSKQKKMVGKECLQHDAEDSLKNDGFYDRRVEQDEFKWHEKSSFLDDNYLDDNYPIYWNNQSSDLDSGMLNYMRSMKCDEPDFSFDMQKSYISRAGVNAAGCFNVSGLSSPYKHQINHRYDFMTSDMTRYNSEFSEMTHSSDWPSFATEEARDHLHFLREDSCMYRPGENNYTERQKYRSHASDLRSPSNNFCMKNDTFSEEFCTKRPNIWKQESTIGSGMRNKMSDYSTRGDDWFSGERCIIENASETRKASHFDCKRWTEDPFDSDFNTEFYDDEKQSSSRSKHDAFSDNFFSEKVEFCQDNPGHSSPVLGNFNQEPLNDSKIDFQKSVSTGESKSVTLPAISSKLHHQTNYYSSSKSETPINVSEHEEPEVKTPENETPALSEGGSSSVEMPQKLEDSRCPNQHKETEIEDSGNGNEKGDLTRDMVDRSCKLMMLGRFVLQLMKTKTYGSWSMVFLRVKDR